MTTDIRPEIAEPARRGPDPSALDRAVRAGSISLWPPTMGWALGLVLIGCGFWLGARVITDNSLLTHLANGFIMHEQGYIVRHDPFSYTAAGESVTMQSWAAAWLYALLYDHGAMNALRVFNGLLGAGLVAMVWALTAAVGRVIPRVMITMLVLGSGILIWSPRPLMFGLLGLAALMLSLNGRLRPIWLVGVLWVWVNTHGSFPMAIAVAGAAVVGAGIDLIISRPNDTTPAEIGAAEPGWTPRAPWPRNQEFSDLRRSGAVLAAVIGGVLLGAVNPLGFELLRFPVALAGRSDALIGVAEWKPPAMNEFAGWLTMVFAACWAAAATRRVPWRQLLPVLGCLVLTTTAIRHLGLLAIVAVPMLVTWVRSEPRIATTMDSGDRSVVSAILALSGVALLTLGIVTAAHGPGFDDSEYPIAEINWLETRGLIASNSVHIVHPDQVGNYLTWRYGPGASVFIDDRFDFYPSDVVHDHAGLWFDGDYGDILDRRDAVVVLWPNHGGFVRWLAESPDWEIGDLDGDWVMGCRRATVHTEQCIGFSSSS